MALWRVRVDVPDEPGRLAGLAAAVRGGGGNILTFEVHRRDDGQVTDELVVDLPATRQVAGLVTRLHDAGATAVRAVPADPHELVDLPTHLVEATARLAVDPDALSAVLGLASGAASVSVAPAPPPADERRLVIPVGGRRVAVLERTWAPFTSTERSRAGRGRPGRGAARRRAPPARVGRHAARRSRADRAAGGVRGRRGARRDVRTVQRADAAPLPGGAGAPWPASGRARGGARRPRSRRGGTGRCPRRARRPAPARRAPVGEVTLLVEDGWQGLGVETALVRRLAHAGREQGLTELVATVALPVPPALSKIFARAGLPVRRSYDGHLMELRVELGDDRRAASRPRHAEPTARHRAT